MPLVSVLIPTYNNAREIGRCLDGVLTQTLTDLEIIVVNDGSTDDTLEALAKYGGKIKVITQKNSGAPAARNRAFRESAGKFVIFCDADLVLAPDALEKMAQILAKNNDISFVYPSFKFGWKLFKGRPFDAEALKKMNYIHTSALIRREHFPGFDERLKKFQDWDLWLTMSERGYKGEWTPEVLFSVIETKGTMSRWLPSFMYKIPWRKFGIKIKTIEKYEAAKRVICEKHQI